MLGLEPGSGVLTLSGVWVSVQFMFVPTVLLVWKRTVIFLGVIPNFDSAWNAFLAHSSQTHDLTDIFFRVISCLTSRRSLKWHCVAVCHQDSYVRRCGTIQYPLDPVLLAFVDRANSAWNMELTGRFMDWYFDTSCLRPHLKLSRAKPNVFWRDIYIFCICTPPRIYFLLHPRIRCEGETYKKATTLQ